jgi:hypothetical protein
MHKTLKVDGADLRAGFEHDGRIARSEGFHKVADRAEANNKWLDDALREAFNIRDAAKPWLDSSKYLAVEVEITVRIEEKEII